MQLKCLIHNQSHKYGNVSSVKTYRTRRKQLTFALLSAMSSVLLSQAASWAGEMSSGPLVTTWPCLWAGVSQKGEDCPLLTAWERHPCGSAGKESTCNAGGLGSIPGLGRSTGEGRLATPVFWPIEFHREFHGLYSPQGCKESDMTEWRSQHYIQGIMFVSLVCAGNLSCEFLWGKSRCLIKYLL